MEQPGPQPDAVLTPTGFSRFYAEHLPTVYGYVLRLAGGDRGLAEDLTQDAFLALTAELRRGHTARADVRWLLTVARSRYIDHVRRVERGRRKLALISRSEVEESDPAPSRQEVLDRVALLEPLHRVALMMRHVEGASVADIAATVGRTTTATYSLLARAREQLRETGGRP
jgi:RNA polymerase sigma-70 factor (ECF subfamily)